MKKIILQSSLIVVVLIIIFLFSKTSYGSNFNNDTNLIKGERAEEIDGMLHKVEYLYGSPLFYDLDSMLDGLGVEVYPEDRLAVFPDPSFGLGSKIVLQRANVVVINDAGQEKIYRTWKTTIQAVLEENGIEVGEKDIIEPDKESRLLAFHSSRNIIAREGREEPTPVIAQVTITRVAETELKEYQSIDYQVITKKDPELEKGKTRIGQYGQKGSKELTYAIRRENGQEVSRQLISSEIVRQPEDKIIYEGTKIVIYGTGTATWYDWIGGMTAASNSLSYGTKVRVVNLANGKSVEVTVVDHGIRSSAIIDLSAEAFSQLAPLGQGRISVRLEKP